MCDLIWKIRRQQRNKNSLPTGWFMGGMYPDVAKVHNSDENWFLETVPRGYVVRTNELL